MICEFIHSLRIEKREFLRGGKQERRLVFRGQTGHCHCVIHTHRNAGGGLSKRRELVTQTLTLTLTPTFETLNPTQVSPHVPSPARQ